MAKTNGTESRITNATKLEKYRLDRCMSYRELADHLDLDYSLIYRWCWRQRIPSIKWAVYLEIKTKISAEYWDRLRGKK